MRDAFVADGTSTLFTTRALRRWSSHSIWPAELRFQVSRSISFNRTFFEHGAGNVFIQGHLLVDGVRQLEQAVRGFASDGTFLGDFVPPTIGLLSRQLAVSDEIIWQIDGAQIVGYSVAEGVEVERVSLPDGFSPAGFGDFTGIATVDCERNDTTASFHAGRFNAEVSYEKGAGDTGVGHVLPSDSSASARLWFFEPENEEILLKVLDGYAINDHYWVFFAATTDVGFELTVTGTETGASQTYTNELGNPANAVTASTAFPCSQ